MKLELDQRDTLDIARFHVLDAVDVEEVVFVIVGDESFHLRRVHAAVRLRDVEHRNSDVGKDVALHAEDAHDAGSDECDHNDQHRNRPAKGKRHEIHGCQLNCRCERKRSCPRYNCHMLQTVSWTGQSARLLDQTKLPTETVYVDITDERQMWDAIKRLVVRGAAEIGVAAAFGVYLGVQNVQGN